MKIYEGSMVTVFDNLLSLREQELCETLRERDAQLDRAAPRWDVSDFKDIAREDSLAAIGEAQAERAALELEQVLAARRRLHDRGYGQCLDCGEPVDLRRLSAMPATPYCASCQEAHEYETALLARH
jgi:DnaK suppressor protein